jgi:hypothetical protein
MNPLEEIKRITQEITNVKDISTKNREIHMVRARCIYYKVSKEELDFAYQKIGRYIKRDHATALHGLKKFDDYIYQSKVFKTNYEQVKHSFNQLKKTDYIIDIEQKELNNNYNLLKTNYDTVIKKQRKDRRKLLVFLRTENISTRLVDISKDLDSKQIEQMFERMEQFAKMCNYHNQKKKVL